MVDTTRLRKINWVGDVSIKIIIAVVFVLLVGFISYNNYSSYQSRESAEARRVETQAIQADLAQQPQSKPKVVPSATVVSVPTASQPQDTAIDTMPVVADGVAEKQSIEKSKQAICKSVTGVAESAMKARLSGVPIQTALTSVDSINDNDPTNVAIKRLYVSIITDAYRMPNFSTEKYKEEAIREFGLKQYLDCTDAFAKY